jgi:hypothetical protein
MGFLGQRDGRLAVRIDDILRELRLNAERITAFLKPDFKWEPGEDVDLDDSFEDAARVMGEGFADLDRNMIRMNVPAAWRASIKLEEPPPPQTREQMIETLKITAKALGYRLVLHPPTKKRSG